MSSHFYFMSFIKGHKICHIYYRLSRYPHSAQDNRLLTHTALFPEGPFAHTHAFREVVWSLLCNQVFTSSDTWHRRITVSASALVAAHSESALSFLWMVIMGKEQMFSDVLKAFFSFPWLFFMWRLCDVVTLKTKEKDEEYDSWFLQKQI